MSHALAQKSILIVDDERVIAESLRAIFSKAGFEARAAFSAEEALQMIAESEPDAVLIDVILPGMNGVELAIMLSSTLPNCRLVLFSGSLHTGTLLKEAEAEGHRFDILPKPIHPTHMLDFIFTLLGETPGPRTAAEAASEKPWRAPEGGGRTEPPGDAGSQQQ